MKFISNTVSLMSGLSLSFEAGVINVVETPILTCSPMTLSGLSCYVLRPLKTALNVSYENLCLYQNCRAISFNL